MFASWTSMACESARYFGSTVRAMGEVSSPDNLVDRRAWVGISVGRGRLSAAGVGRLAGWKAGSFAVER